MTIMDLVVTALTRVALTVVLVVTPTLVVFTTLGTSATGGVLPLQAAPMRGLGVCSTSAAMSLGAAAAEATASLLVASGIKILDI